MKRPDQIIEVLANHGAMTVAEIEAETGLSGHAVRSAIRRINTTSPGWLVGVNVPHLKTAPGGKPPKVWSLA